MEFANTVRKGAGDANVLKHLVVDSGAIIKAERLEHVAENSGPFKKSSTRLEIPSQSMC